MNKLIILKILLFTTICVFATDPVLLFSDIESGPKNEWSVAEPNKGAAVSVWGKDFGNTKSTSFITVNGTALTATSDYAVWGEHWPTQYFHNNYL